jgi:hypothetical protein
MRGFKKFSKKKTKARRGSGKIWTHTVFLILCPKNVI